MSGDSPAPASSAPPSESKRRPGHGERIPISPRVVPVLRVVWWLLLGLVPLIYTSYLDLLVGELTVAWAGHVAMLLALFGVTWLQLQDRRKADISAAAMVIAAIPWLPQLRDDTAPKLEEGQAVFRALVANTSYEGGRAELLVSEIERSRAVLVALLEPPPDLTAALEATGHWRVLAAHLTGEEDNVALLLRTDVKGFEVLRAEVVTLDYTPMRLVEAELRFGGRTLHVMAAHAPPPLGFDEHAARARFFPDVGARLKSPGLMLADLATSRASPHWRLLRQYSLRRAQGSPPATWPSWLGPVGIAIDYVMLKGPLTASDTTSIALSGSDHRGVYADIGVPKPKDPESTPPDSGEDAPDRTGGSASSGLPRTATVAEPVK